MTSGTVQPSDEALAIQARDGGMDAFEQLVLRYEKRLFGFFVVRLNDRQTAEDLTQETFLRAFRHIRNYEPEHAFKTWLFTIAHRLAISQYRKRKPVMVMETGDIDNRTPAADCMADERRRNIWATARRSLTPDQAAVVVLKYKEDMSVKDIADSMNKSVANIKVLLHRARKQLAVVLKKREQTDDVLVGSEALET